MSEQPTSAPVEGEYIPWAVDQLDQIQNSTAIFRQDVVRELEVEQDPVRRRMLNVELAWADTLEGANRLSREQWELIKVLRSEASV